MKRKAIALLRVSSDAQAGEDRLGLPAQRRKCERIAETNGLDIADGDWVTLKGVSGAAVLDDPKFRRLLDRMANPEITAVVVADFDRLFRRGRFSDFQVLDAFADTGTLLYTSDGKIDLSKDGDALVSILRGEIGGMERRKIAERTRRAREEKRRLGLKAEGQGLPRGVCFDHETKK